MTGYQKLQGTVSYMSPEQIDKAPDIDGKTDIYSLGLLLYEVMTGILPVTGDAVDKVIASVRNEVPKPPSELVISEIPKVLENAIMSCLEKDRADRMQSAGELVRLLKQAY